MKKLFIILLMVFSCSSQPKVKVGQIWEYVSDDPFDKFTKTMLIVDIREGYAKYLYKWSTLNDIYSTSDIKEYFNHKTYLRKATHDDSVIFNLVPKVVAKDTLKIKFNTSPDTVLARFTEGDNLLWIRLYNGSEMTLKREKTGFRIIKLKSKDGDSLGIK